MAASRLIWEQIWEQNAVKPPMIGAMWRIGPDTRRPLTCAFETVRTRENPWCVAHNLEVAAEQELARIALKLNALKVE